VDRPQDVEECQRRDLCGDRPPDLCCDDIRVVRSEEAKRRPWFRHPIDGIHLPAPSASNLPGAHRTASRMPTRHHWVLMHPTL